ncbi:LutC/YkgG family protein [Algihabitans albus]|uniref:LutC/YkgG family protein n=1 Tax=Algihabitans albus TaxID=2164067 RepID=UPI000E5D8370|nr:lactate utilization protein [Algihabitans albus]
MSAGREAVLGAVRRSLGHGATDTAAARARIAAHPRGLLPERSQREAAAQVDLFQEQVEAVNATVVRLASLEEVPRAAADYLKDRNLPGALRLAPEPELQTLPWAETAPMLSVASGKAEPEDATSLTAAFAGVAETGTLMLHSGPKGPTTLNFLPENHIVVLKTSQVVGAYEEAWDRMRRTQDARTLPRTVNLITGPSRTGDIEQTIQLGAHGPRRLHILLVEDAVE